VGEAGPWYLNDHGFVRGPDGMWHMFGITHAEPAAPDREREFAHATAPALDGPWQKHPSALVAETGAGETVLWAPHVIERDGTFYMFYCGGGADATAYQIRLATSRDLWTWERHPLPLFTDGYHARDPHVLRVHDEWVLFYTATMPATGGQHVVAARRSRDLVNWGPAEAAFTDVAAGTSGGPTESPFVLPWRDRWLLFIGPRPDYVGTDVFVSDDPLSFSADARVGHIAAHAAEVVRDGDGTLLVSSAGWGQGGLHLAQLSLASTCH
jgi:beta-fructofuranosidase